MEPMFNLVISYKDDREDVYQLGDGIHILGSDSNCELSIQDAGILGKHAAFVVKNGRVSVENLHQNGIVRLNGIMVAGRRELDIGDTVEIGGVCARLRITGCNVTDLTTSPNGVAEVATSARKDIRSGWRGYRKALEEISPFISPEEAQKAAQWHKEGLGALVRCFIALSMVTGLSWVFESNRLFLWAGVTGLVWDVLSSFLILYVTVRYRIRFAGRIIVLGQCIFAAYCNPPDASWLTYFDNQGPGGIFVILLAYFLGWLYDIGAGCVFANSRKQFILRYMLLVVFTSALNVLTLIMEEASPISNYWNLLTIGVVLFFPLWAKIVPRSNLENHLDISFVAELASIRTWRTWKSYAIAILAVSAPLFYVLANLGATEMLVWDNNDEGLIVTQESSDDKLAWFWEDRGRYFLKNDLDAELIYQVPYMALAPQLGEILSCDSTSPGQASNNENGANSADNGTSRQDDGYSDNEQIEEIRNELCGKISRFAALSLFDRILLSKGINKDNNKEVETFLETDDGNIALSNCAARVEGLALGTLGEKICGLIVAVQNNATNRAAYAELENLLVPYRVKTSDAEKFVSHLGSKNDAQVFYLKETENRETFQSGPNPRLYAAKLNIGIRAKTQSQASIEAGKVRSIIVPSFVLLCFGGLLLWRRGGDSAVGFWMGIFLVGNAFHVLGMDDLNASVRYNLWCLATQSHIGSIIASWYATLEVAGELFSYVAVFAQSVLFVLLCWPSKNSGQRGKTMRCCVFMGKFLVAFSLGAGAGIIAALLVADDSLILPLSRVLCIITLCLIGWLLRRRRRFATEVPEMGWEFAVGWILLAISVSLPLSLSQVEDLQPFKHWFASIAWFPDSMSLLDIVTGTCAVLSGVLLLRFMLRKNFLSVLSPRGFTFMVLASSLPVFSELCESFAQDLVHGTFLQSQLGEEILCISITIILLAPLFKGLESFSRKLSMRNLVKVEANVERTLESVLDNQDDVDIRDEIFERMRDLGLARYAFYVRGRSGAFNLLLKNGWTGKSVHSFFVSEYLRGYLGKNHQAIDMGQLAQERRLFFQSFELHRLAAQLHAGCLQPICLGSSVRALIVTPEDSDNPILSNNEVFFGNVNALGLATVASLGQNMPTREKNDGGTA